MVELCDEHSWATVGVTADDGTVFRVWACEHCPAWTREEFDPEYEVDWNETWLAGM